MSRRESVLFWMLMGIGFAFGIYRYTVLHELQLDTLTMIKGLQDQLIISAAENEAETEVTQAGYVITEEDLGDFTITYYCGSCEKCQTNGITASGRVATPGRTVAVDPAVIPLGSVLCIDGHYYVAEDKGGAIKGHRIDICVSNHEEALRLGTETQRVYLTSLEPVY